MIKKNNEIPKSYWQAMKTQMLRVRKDLHRQLKLASVKYGIPMEHLTTLLIEKFLTEENLQEILEEVRHKASHHRR